MEELNKDNYYAISYEEAHNATKELTGRDIHETFIDNSKGNSIICTSVTTTKPLQDLIPGKFCIKLALDGFKTFQKETVKCFVVGIKDGKYKIQCFGEKILEVGNGSELYYECLSIVHDIDENLEVRDGVNMLNLYSPGETKFTLGAMGDSYQCTDTLLKNYADFVLIFVGSLPVYIPFIRN